MAQKFQPLHRDAVISTFGSVLGTKLLNWLDPCCEAFCNDIDRCLGISADGDPDLVLNQNGDWVPGGGSGGSCCYEVLTYADAAALKVAETVVPAKTYFLSDRNIIITGVSTTEFSLDGKRAFRSNPTGGIRLSDITAGDSIDTITADGDAASFNLISGPVSLAGTPIADAQTLANAIQSNFGSTGIGAIASGESIILIGNATTNDTYNTTISTTGTVVATSDPFKWTIEAGEKWFDILYDFDNDLVIRQSDEKSNVVTTSVYAISNTGVSAIDIFPWGSPEVNNNIVEAGLFLYYSPMADPIQVSINHVYSFLTVYAEDGNKVIGNFVRGALQVSGYADLRNNTVNGQLVSTGIASKQTSSNTVDTSLTISDGATVRANHIIGVGGVTASGASTCNNNTIGTVLLISDNADIQKSQVYSSLILSGDSVVLECVFDTSNVTSTITDSVQIAYSSIHGELILSGSSQINNITLLGSSHLTVTDSPVLDNITLTSANISVAGTSDITGASFINGGVSFSDNAIAVNAKINNSNLHFSTGDNATGVIINLPTTDPNSFPGGQQYGEISKQRSSYDILVSTNGTGGLDLDADGTRYAGIIEITDTPVTLDALLNISAYCNEFIIKPKSGVLTVDAATAINIKLPSGVTSPVTFDASNHAYFKVRFDTGNFYVTEMGTY